MDVTPRIHRCFEAPGASRSCFCPEAVLVWRWSGDPPRNLVMWHHYQVGRPRQMLQYPESAEIKSRTCLCFVRLKEFDRCFLVFMKLMDDFCQKSLLKLKMWLRRFEQPRLVFFPVLRVPMVSGTWNTSHPNQHSVAQVCQHKTAKSI